MARPTTRSVLLFALLFVPTEMANAFGRDDAWVSGWGQGVAEALVTYGAGNQIYVTCNEGGSTFANTGISFMLAGRSPTGSAITLTFDGENPERISLFDGEITSDCHVCSANYEYVIDRFKHHNSVHVMFENGDAAEFTLRGSSKAIVACTPDFAR